MKSKRVLMSSLLVAAAMSGMMAGMEEASAQSSSEELEPIVYFLIDTSRSMNNIMTSSGVDDNNTRLTKALGEIAGASKNVSEGKLVRDSVDHPHQFKLPYSVWLDDKYQHFFKTIGPKSDATYPDLDERNENYVDYDNAYDDDGVIQLYKDKVKFGFAGFAVGSSDGGTGTSEIEDNVRALGGEEGKYLRFTLIWGEKYQSCSDIDLHAYIYKDQYAYEHNDPFDHIYYSNDYSGQPKRCSRYGCDNGKLDIDNLMPVKKDNYNSHEEPGGIWSGYENIFWNDISRMQDGYIISMRIHNYNLDKHHQSGYREYEGICTNEQYYRTEIATADENMCKTYYNIKYTGSLDWNGDVEIASVRFDGTKQRFVPNFTDDFFSTRSNFELITSGMANRPDNIYGLKEHSRGGIRYGRKISDSYKHNMYCKFDVGIWDSVGFWNKNLSSSEPEENMNYIPAPLNYPTAFNTPDKIEASNMALTRNVRTYTATANTPIGESLADLYYLLGADSSPDFKQNADQAVWKQSNGGSDIQTDDFYNCRDKAVVLITDGGPLGSGYDGDNENEHGHSIEVWYDAKHLSEAGVKVFPVGYAEFKLTPNERKINLKTDDPEAPDYKSKKAKIDAIHTLNKTALYGGTCRHPETHKLLTIGDLDGEFKAFDDKVDESIDDLSDRTCFYYAADSTALRAALVSALTEMLQGDYSKTKIVNSSAIGAFHNYDSRRNSTNSGYYRVYSGYSTSLAPIRKAKLQRESTVCNHATGLFKNDENQFLDLAHRLKCRLTSCDMWRAATANDTDKILGMNYKFSNDVNGVSYLKRAGFDVEPKHCAPQNSKYEMLGSSNENSCLQDRYIFSAKYNDTGDSGDRYAISIFPVAGNVGIGDSAILKNIGINNDGFGIIPNGKGTKAGYFLTNSNEASCKIDISGSEYNISKYNQISDVNYLVSPYECFDDMDCGMSGKKLRHCDLGRCIDDVTISKCSSNPGGGKICVNHELRNEVYSCSRHSECASGQVCHAGLCVSGVVKNCDIRQFIASQPLGIIEYATPVTVVPPSRPYRSSDYIQFASKYKQRDIMLMVGANDGMLHSFILGNNDTIGAGADHSAGDYRGAVGGSIYNIHSMPDYHVDIDAGNKEGDELWAFIPKMMMPKLSSLVKHDHATSYINGTPVVSDVRLPGFTINDDAWRTVLVGGFRNGGRGYYAMDITDPGHPFVLWEIDNQWKLGAGSNKVMGEKGAAVTSTETSFPFNMMGYSYAEPVITKMLIDNVPEPVVILSGGKAEADSDSSRDRTGKVLYIVKLYPKSKDDLIVKTFYFENQITGTPAVYPNNFDATAQVIYVGDSKGALYRLNVSGSERSQWGATEKLSGGLEAPAFDPRDLGAGSVKPVFSPITFPPAVSLYDTVAGKPVIQVAFGTGSNDSFYVDDSENHYFASFIDVPVTEDGETKYELNREHGAFKPSVIILNASDDLSLKASENLGYHIYVNEDRYGQPIPKGQKLTGAPITYNYATYFPTFMISNDKSDKYCPVGGAAIWKIESEDGEQSKKITQVLSNEAIQKNGELNDPFLVAGHPRSFYPLNNGTKIYGLEITNMQYCANSDFSGKSYSVAPQLIAQTSADSDDEYSMTSSQRSAELKGSALTDVPAIAIELEAIAPVLTPSVWMSIYE